MAKESDATYYERRMREERERAVTAESPAIGEIHAVMADSYAGRLAGDAPHPRDRPFSVQHVSVATARPERAASSDSV